MKRVLFLASFLILTIGLLVSCSGECEHENTVKEPGKAYTCTEDGLTDGILCEDCGEVILKQQVISAAHKWNDGEITKEASCTEKGTKIYTCSACGETRTEEIDKGGHAFSSEWTIDKEATCQEVGSKSHHCTECGEIKDITEIPVSTTAHVYDDTQGTTVDATCTEEGSITNTCLLCNTETTTPTDPLGHSFTNYTPTDASCEKDAYKTAKCDRCEETSIVTEPDTALGHTYGADGRCERCSVINPALKITSFEIINETFLLEAGVETQIKLAIYPEGALYENITYKIYQNNTCEATLSETGVLTCSKVGSVTLAVTIDGEYTQRVTFYVPKIITTAQEFFDIRNDLGGVYKLANDIDLSAYTNWTPIGNATRTATGDYDYSNAFSGKFDGGGYTIKGININLDNSSCSDLLTVGLFGSLSRDGQISNVNLENVKINGTNSATDYIGLLTGFNPGSVENCNVKGTISVSGPTYIGGVMGENIGSAENVSSDINITVSGSKPYNVGGITGRTTGGQLSKVDVLGTIKVESSYSVYVGGVAGNLLDQLTTASADVDITVITTYGQSSDSCDYIGVIAGSSAHPLSDINVDGSIKAESYYNAYIGGVVGYCSAEISNCVNNVEITFSSTNTSSTYTSSTQAHIAGIVGYTPKSVDTCINNGKITAASINGGYIGGIAGDCSALSNSENNAAVYVKSTSLKIFLGGVAGNVTSVDKSTNNGKITAYVCPSVKNYIGGVVGYSSGNISNCKNELNSELKIKYSSSTSSTSEQYFAGVAGYTNADVKKSENYATISVDLNSSVYLGGVVGYSDGNTEETNNYGYSITLKASGSSLGIYVGGVIGHSNGNAKETNNYGYSITIEAPGSSQSICVGGVIGHSNGNAKETNNYGYSITIKAPGSSQSNYVGGVVGYIDGTLTDAYNTSILSVNKCGVSVGGVAGYTNAEVSNAYSTANISVNNENSSETIVTYVGGVVGQASSSIKNSTATGGSIQVDSKNEIFVGGVAGKCAGSIIESYSYPSISVANAYDMYVGGLCGYANSVSKCFSTSGIIGTTYGSYELYAGGLCGYISASADESYASGDVNATSSSKVYVAGLIGYVANGANVKNCYSSNGFVKTNSSIYSSSLEIYSYNGGLVAYNNGTISNCYSVNYNYSTSHGSANSHSHYIGGLVGFNNGTVTSSFTLSANAKFYRPNLGISRDVNATGSAKCFYAGGFAGYNQGTLSNCYSEATVDSTASGGYTGAFSGYNVSQISNSIAYGEVNAGQIGDKTGGFSGGGTSGYTACFFSTDATNQTTAVGNTANTGITASTNAELRTASTFAGFSSSYWNIVDGTYITLVFGNAWESRSDGENKYNMLVNVPCKDKQYQFPHDTRVNISFEGSGNQAVEPIVTNKGSTIVLPQLEGYFSNNSNYIFFGWFKDAELTQPAERIQTVTDDAKYYACFKMIVSKPLTSTFTYSGETISVAEKYVSNDYYTVEGSFQGVDAGEYKITFKLNDAGYCWSDGTDGDYILTWTITPSIVNAPAVYDGGNFIYYTGSERDLESELENTAYTISGDTKISALNLDKHTITISLSNDKNYIWADGTSSSKSFDYYIASGSCSENGEVSYLFLNNNLYILGIGDMRSYSNYNGSAWYTQRENIYNIIFSEGISSIGDYAFRGCTSLTSITIPESVTSIGYDAFYNCTSLKTVTFGENSKLESIGSYAFSGCTNLKTITFGENSKLESIGSYAFSGCYRLVEVYNKSNLTITKGSYNYGYIGYNALNVYTPTSGESKLETRSDGFVFYSDGDKNYLVNYLGNETELTLPENYKGGSYKIYNYAFYNNTSLTSITIPESVTSIGNYAFSGCASLKTVTFGENSKLESIGSYAFYGCSSLTSITIPESVTSIGSDAFYNCTSLKTVNFGENSKLESIGYEAFYACVRLTSITIPKSVTSIGYYAFQNCQSLTIYAETSSQPGGWSSSWNSSDCPVVWGYTGE